VERSVAHLGLLDDEAITLDAAALELAWLDHPDTDITRYTTELSNMADELAVRADDIESSHDRAQALGEVIAGAFGFDGDRVTYDIPDNADMIRVIDRRRGLPVSLTILYVAAARRVGWEADVLNTPGHVLGRIGGETDQVLIDPFNRGAIIDSAAISALLAGVFGRPVEPSAEHLAPMSNRTVLVRLLMNQASRAEANGNLTRALELFERMTVVAPEHTHAWWEVARLRVAMRDPAGARSSLSAMLEITREPGLRSHICAALDALARLSG
jgi:regulator of sirC expression with transglutaminase-like and TPR domain